MSICDVIHKIGGTQHITTPPEKDRTMAIGNMHRKFGEDGRCGSEDMIVDKHTDTRTDRQTRSSQYSTPLGLQAFTVAQMLSVRGEGGTGTIKI